MQGYVPRRCDLIRGREWTVGKDNRVSVFGCCVTDPSAEGHSHIYLPYWSSNMSHGHLKTTPPSTQHRPPRPSSLSLPSEPCHQATSQSPPHHWWPLSPSPAYLLGNTICQRCLLRKVGPWLLGPFCEQPVGMLPHNCVPLTWRDSAMLLVATAAITLDSGIGSGCGGPLPHFTQSMTHKPRA